MRRRLFALGLVMLGALVCLWVQAPRQVWAGDAKPIYHTLDELEGKRFAYVNGSVYNQSVQERISGTSEDFYASLPDCVAAVEAGKADAAVQLSYCCQLVVNRKGGSVALLPRAWQMCRRRSSLRATIHW